MLLAMTMGCYPETAQDFDFRHFAIRKCGVLAMTLMS
jgi:hypothetical protein